MWVKNIRKSMINAFLMGYLKFYLIQKKTYDIFLVAYARKEYHMSIKKLLKKC